MKKLLSFILICATVFSCATLTACKKVDVDIEKEWRIVAYDDGEGEVFEQKVCFDVTRNSKKIDEVWLRVTEMSNKVESVNLTLQRYSTDSTSGSIEITLQGTAYTTAITKQDYNRAKKELNGWIKVTKDAWQHNSSYVILICEGNITIDEIVFVDENGKRLTGEVEYADFVFENTDGDMKNKIYTSSDISALTGVKYGTPLNLLNDQESFDKKEENK